MSNKKNSGNVSGMEATAEQNPLAVQVSEINSKLMRFNELQRKIKQHERLGTDLEFLQTAKVQGADIGEDAEDNPSELSKIVLQFDGADRYNNTYNIVHPVLMAELISHLKNRFSEKRAELQAEIIGFAI